MDDIVNWIEETYDELDSKIQDQENSFLDMFYDFASEFTIDDKFIKNSGLNIRKVSEINSKFDDAYDTFVSIFLVWYASKLLEAGKLSLQQIQDQGFDAKNEDIDFLEKLIGISSIAGGYKILKNSFLFNLGQFAELKQAFQDFVMQAVVSTQRFNVFLANIRPYFKSTKGTRSQLSKYHLKHSYDVIMQVMNSTSYYLAKKYNATHFDYIGGLIEKSRQFCIERDGKTFTMNQGQLWNDLNWNGKINGIDFFVQVGGYSCRHYLKYYTK